MWVHRPSNAARSSESAPFQQERKQSPSGVALSLGTTSERIRRRSARSRIAHQAGADDRDVRVIGSSARTAADPGRLEQVPYEPEDRSTPELLRDWAAIMRELRARDVVRTNNNPVGDIAEAIVAEHYGGERGSFSQAGWDVRTLQGERIQVKAMRQTAGAKRHNVSPIRDRDYDFVVIVILDEDFVVTEGLRLSRDVVEELFDHRDYVNGRIITVTNVLRGDIRVEKVDLSAAAERLGT